MLNKKAIAAFAAGATLLSGMAFAAPAMAAGAAGDGAGSTASKPDKATLEKQVKELTAKVADDQKALNDATDKQKAADAALAKFAGKFKTLEAAVTIAQANYDEAKTKYTEYTAAKTAAKTAVDAYVEAHNALTKLFDGGNLPVAITNDVAVADVANKKAEDFTKAAAGASAADYSATAEDKFVANDNTTLAAKRKAANDAADALAAAAENAAAAVKKVADLKGNDEPKDPDARNNATGKALKDAKKALESAKKDNKDYTKAEADKKTADEAVAAAKKKFDADNAALTKAKEALKAFGEDVPPVTPTTDPFNFITDNLDPKDQSQAIDFVRLAAMNLQNAENNHAVKLKAYQDARKALLAAEAEFNARTAAAAAAKQALTDFLAKGATDSATETKLSDAVDRANAHVVRATKALADALAKFEAARKDAFASVAAYNHALSEYKRLYNKAIEMGVNPALLPPVKTADPLTPNFPDITSAKELYAQALSGKFGKDAQAAAEKCGKACGADKKADAKKCADKAAPLAKTGAAVALAAVAASVLAGMGAALRKIRH